MSRMKWDQLRARSFERPHWYEYAALGAQVDSQCPTDGAPELRQPHGSPAGTPGPTAPSALRHTVSQSTYAKRRTLRPLVPDPDPTSILEALDDEIAATKEPVRFDVEGVERVVDPKVGVLWRVTLSVGDSSRNQLHEDLEGQSAWWPGPPKGTADVLTVLPEESQIVLRFASIPPPDPGGAIFVFPPQYLESLREAWSDPVWAARCVAWLQHAASGGATDTSDTPNPSRAGVPLRDQQRDAFSLPRWSVSFLWGPPGTGKTYTVGALLAEYLRQFHRGRALILSTTNVAVDQALVAVDKALEASRVAPGLRSQCQRVGQHYVAANYGAREHLLPQVDRQALAALARLESSAPPSSDIVAYAAWKREVEAVRRSLRRRAAEVLAGARLAAITTTAAAFLLETLRAQPQYDLLVFDEASQVGLAHAVALAPLARRVVFAGDPQQLEPIVRAGSENASVYLGQSAFVLRDANPNSVCFLREQARMSAPICAVVSGAFYDRKLVVASDAARDPSWLVARTPSGLTELARRSVHIQHDCQEAQWSPTYGGPIRWSSADWVARHIEELLEGATEQDVIVLTPYRAQRHLIRQKLRGAGAGSVRVSTVHKFQGSERHTVVFDPVDGTNPFFLEHGERLATVALSRAQCRLYILVSPADLENPVLRRVCECAGPFARGRRPPGLPALSQAAALPGFPGCATGQSFWIDVGDGFVGFVEGVVNDKFVIVDRETGLRRLFLTNAFVRSASAPDSNPPVEAARQRTLHLPPGNPHVRLHRSGARLVRPADDRRRRRR